MAIAIKIWGETTTFALILGVGAGLLFGALMTLATRKQRREFRLVLETIPQDDWKVARRAAWRGPVPVSSEVRVVAAQLAGQQLEQHRRNRKLIAIVFGLNLAIAVLNVILTPSPWRALLVAGWTVFLISQWYSPRRLRRRIALLNSDPIATKPPQ